MKLLPTNNPDVKFKLSLNLVTENNQEDPVSLSLNLE
jgi:hypothetical protein